MSLPPLSAVVKAITFSVAGDDGAKRTLRVNVREVMESGRNFGLYVWDSALILSELLCQLPHLVKGQCILELGCGVGLPGIVAAKLGAASVTLSDADIFPHVLHNCKINCTLNNLNVAGCGGDEDDGNDTDNDDHHHHSTVFDEITPASLKRRRIDISSSCRVAVDGLSWGRTTSSMLRTRRSTRKRPHLLLGADIFYNIKGRQKRSKSSS